MAAESNSASTEQIQEELEIALGAMNALDFARYLYPLALPDATKNEWLLKKVNQSPKEDEDLLRRAIERNASEFWARLASEVKGQR